MFSLGHGIQPSGRTLGNVAEMRKASEANEDFTKKLVFFLAYEEVHEFCSSHEFDHSEKGDSGLVRDSGDSVRCARFGHTRKKVTIGFLRVYVKDLSNGIGIGRIILLVWDVLPDVFVQVLVLRSLRKT